MMIGTEKNVPKLEKYVNTKKTQSHLDICLGLQVFVRPNGCTCQPAKALPLFPPVYR